MKGDISQTFELLNLALDYTICDDNLFDYMSDKLLIECNEKSSQRLFVDAVFSLYKGNYEIGLEYISKYLSIVIKNTNALYVQMRLNYMLNRWNEADQIIEEICEMENHIIPKIYFRGGIINHCFLDLPGIGILQTIIKQYPKSIETYEYLQQFCREKNLALPENSESNNDIITEFNKEPFNPKFINVLTSNMDENNEIFQVFRDTLLNEVFE